MPTFRWLATVFVSVNKLRVLRGHRRRLYVHRIIFIVIDTFTSYKVAIFYDCDDASRLGGCRIMSARPDLMKKKPSILLSSQFTFMSRQSSFSSFITDLQFVSSPS